MGFYSRGELKSIVEHILDRMTNDQSVHIEFRAREIHRSGPGGVEVDLRYRGDSYTGTLDSSFIVEDSIYGRAQVEQFLYRKYTDMRRDIDRGHSRNHREMDIHPYIAPPGHDHSHGGAMDISRVRSIPKKDCYKEDELLLLLLN